MEKHRPVRLGVVAIEKRDLGSSLIEVGNDLIYFINAKNYYEKPLTMDTSLLLNQNLNIDTFDVKPVHLCTFYANKLCEEGSKNICQSGKFRTVSFWFMCT